ncbi:glutamyl-tRNA reductase [Chloroflexota bacterium]
MHISVVGLNHRSAPVTIREKAAIRTQRLRDSLESLRAYSPHGVLLSTCNRTEVYTISSGDSQSTAVGLDFLQEYLDIPRNTLHLYTYVLEGKAVVEHLFRVTCGLDSMVIGEYEVLGQVRQALEAAEEAEMVSLPLRRLFQSAVKAGRKVREETEISKNALSVSSVAVELAAKALGDLASCKMLVIGAGEAGRLAARAAKERGVSHIGVVSRTHERASELAAQLGGWPIGIGSIADELTTCDLVIACVDAPHYVLDASTVEATMEHRPGTPLVIIDIGMPRNVAPSVTRTNNVFLYNIDDLTSISDHNRKQREGEVEKAGEIIAAEVKEFFSWWQVLEVRPVTAALMKKAEGIRRSHLNRTLKKLPPLSEKEQYSLEMMTRAIVTKILKEPIHSLKTNGRHNIDYAEIVRELFQLDVEKGK